MDKLEYTVIKGAVRHGGESYKEGKPIELTEKQAAPLLALKVIEASGKAVAATGDGKEREAKIVAAFGQLADGDMTQSGKPKVAAVERITDIDVSADEVAKLWEAHEKAIEASGKTVGATGDGKDREAKIIAAFGQLAEDDMTQDGTPKVAAVERITGIDDVTADEVATLWEAHEKDGKQ